tara:strand:+ start:472 stop:996 length:525 start_codon:yes stop_codon:yes gene_type:complete
MKNKNFLVFGGTGNIGSIIINILSEKNLKFVSFSKKKLTSNKSNLSLDINKKISKKKSNIINSSDIIIFALKKKDPNSSFISDLSKLIYYELIFPLSIIDQHDNKNKTFIFLNSDSIFNMRSKKIYILSKLISYFLTTKILTKFYKSKFKTLILTKSAIKNKIILKKELKKYYP